MVAVAEPFVRVLVRVPEAYWLVKDYETTRPGVLFLDAAGRKLGDVALDAGKPEEGAATLLATAARAAEAEAGSGGAPASVDVVLDLETEVPADRAESLSAALSRLGGVLSVRLEGKRLVVTASRLLADPDGLTGAAGRLGATVRSASHARTTLAVEMDDTPATLRVGRLEKLDGVVSAWPDLARGEVRVLRRRGTAEDAALRAAAREAGLTLPPDRSPAK